MRPICVKCAQEMTKEVAGILVAELYLKNKEIYKLWYADYYQCRTCQITIIHDFAETPFWQCHEISRDSQKDAAIETAKINNKYFEVKETKG